VTELPRILTSTPLPGLGRPLTEGERELFGKYLELLIKWQRVQRLIGSAEPAWIVENVFLDSLAFVAALPADAGRVADIGSGAGIPGIPVAIVRRDLRVTLIESRQRRVSFLSTVVRELGLDHVDVVGSRVEELDATYRAAFDAVVMRCAGERDAMLAVARRLAKPGGIIIVAAGPDDTPNDETELVIVRMPSGTLRTLRRYTTRPATA
jgi:16S rRNA (guanine527-N7)-methyltransferase